MLDLSLIDAKNDNARAGRRNAMCNKINAAANDVSDGDETSAIDQIMGLLQKLDGEAKPTGWMIAPPERDEVVAALEDLAVLTGYL